MVVLANGSRYLPEIASQQVLSEADLKALQSDLMNKLEASVGSLRVRRVYGAITFGAPCAVLERDYEVRLPQNIDDTSDICPGFDSQEDIDSGCRGRVTILTYQRLKFKLYQIAAPITRELYFR
ncbi:hypothetical protein PV05_10678 [Exophiala xenobiotica]|uniref:Uncharacterized protein n=1 Tax=Exophiala xenobiotica TaxID=348802 RepID=A0A0D2BIA6_9EURO|nr:uncharacterized protein PV05_10678 [Exophiala xenobiotica]KIW52016.1 hypothetical protein PV05_10678 [Exophiala xenobiotica]